MRGKVGEGKGEGGKGVRMGGMWQADCARRIGRGWGSLALCAPRLRAHVCGPAAVDPRCRRTNADRLAPQRRPPVPPRPPETWCPTEPTLAVCYKHPHTSARTHARMHTHTHTHPHMYIRPPPPPPPLPPPPCLHLRELPILHIHRQGAGAVQPPQHAVGDGLVQVHRHHARLAADLRRRQRQRLRSKRAQPCPQQRSGGRRRGRGT